MSIQILAFAESLDRGRAVVRLASGECIRISIFDDWYFVKNSKFGWIGRVLYKERGRVPLLVAGILAEKFWDIDTPAIVNLKLQGFMKGVFACTTVTEVELMIKRAHEHVVNKGVDAVSDELFR